MATCLHINLIFTGVYSVDLTPVKQKENSLEGTSVSLSYTLSKIATGSDDFFWYRQYPGEPPELLSLLFLSPHGLHRASIVEGLLLSHSVLGATLAGGGA